MPLVDLMKVGVSIGVIYVDDRFDNEGLEIEIGYVCIGDNPDQWAGTEDEIKEKHDELCKCGGVISRIIDTLMEKSIWDYVEDCVKKDVHPYFTFRCFDAWYVNKTEEHVKAYKSAVVEIWSIFNELDERGIVYIVCFGEKEVQKDFYDNRLFKTKTKSAAKIT